MSSIRKVFKVMKFSGMKEHSYLFLFHLLCLIHSMKSNEIFEKLVSFLLALFSPFNIITGKKLLFQVKFVVAFICPGIELT